MNAEKMSVGFSFLILFLILLLKNYSLIFVFHDFRIEFMILDENVIGFYNLLGVSHEKLCLLNVNLFYLFLLFFFQEIMIIKFLDLFMFLI